MSLASGAISVEPDEMKPSPPHYLLRHTSVIAAIIASLLVSPVHADERTLVVRERAEASLLGGDFSFKLLKIRGYSVDVRIAGEKRKLKFGQTFSPPSVDCSVTFDEISPETRIARFVTDCP